MYNTKFHTTTKMSPFEALYNLVEVVAYIVNTREHIAKFLQVNLQKGSRKNGNVC